jgi:hypothetical protein
MKTATMPALGDMFTAKNVVSVMTMGTSNLIMNDTIMGGLSTPLPTFGGKSIDAVVGDAAVNAGKKLFKSAFGAFKNKKNRKSKKNGGTGAS